MLLHQFMTTELVNKMRNNEFALVGQTKEINGITHSISMLDLDQTRVKQIDKNGRDWKKCKQKLFMSSFSLLRQDRDI